MPLADHLHIERRFLRSIRIDTDVRDIKALEGFVCPASSAEVLLAMARHVSETGQGAFTWTGPYGSGKSSLVVALSALLNGFGSEAAGRRNFWKETRWLCDQSSASANKRMEDCSCRRSAQ